ncbi:hypothetical protein NE237_031735 [Protea cynaroides]|uniref:Uncharacterized protein n=1 Tax=Protea cynaroides TaxID=273540 RepID=A0A9Q0L1U0_9MAGN|nr:hypothetical protein NE237_031735 [Protea cynaroides]
MDIRVLLSPPFFVRLTSTLLIMLMHRSLVLLLFFFMVAILELFYMRMECIANTINLLGFHQERTRFLYAFKHSPDINTVFLSKLFSVQNSDLSVFSLAVLPHQLRKGVKLYLGIRFKGGFDMRSVRDLVNKRGCGKIDGQIIILLNRGCQLSCPFQFNKPKEGLQGRKKLYNDGGDAGNREDHISELILALT